METRNTKTQPLRLGYSRLLSFIEKNAQSSFLKTILTSLGSRAFVIVLGFFTSIIVARTLGPVGRGYLGVATTLTGLGVQLGLLGFHSSNTFYVSKNPYLLPTMISNSILISCIIGGFTTIILFFMRYLIIGDTTLPLPLLLISLALIPLNICFLLFQGLLTGIQKFKHYNLSEVFNKSIHVFLILAFFLIGTFSVTTIILFQGIAITVSLLFMFRAFSQPLKTWKAPSFSLIKKNFFYGGKSYLACFFGWGIIRMDVFILQRFQGFEEVGYFSVALSLIDILLMFSAVIAGILLPKLCVETDLQKKWALTKKTTLWSTTIILIGSLLLTLWKAPIEWMFGPQFIPCHQALLFLLPAFILLSVETILVQFIISIRLPWSLVVIWAVALILKLGISLGLTPSIGIAGIGISGALTYLFVLAAICYSIRSILKQKQGETPLDAPT